MIFVGLSVCFCVFLGHGGWNLHTDLSLESLAESLTGHLVGSKVHYYEVVSSTMDEAKRLADCGCAEGTVVLADNQVAGRGRFDRNWFSPQGENLYFSVVLRPYPDQLPYINMAAALAVSTAIEKMIGIRPSIKWPNDVIIDCLKVAGILLEVEVIGSDIRSVVVGIGLNVNLDPARFPEIVGTATSLSNVKGVRFNRTRVLTAVLESFDELYEQVRNGDSLTESWSAEIDTLGRLVEVHWGESVIEGIAMAVDEQGNLQLKLDNGSVKSVSAGEVTLRTLF